MKSFHSIAHYAQCEATGHFFHYHLSLQRALEGVVDEFHAYVPLSATFSEFPKGWKKWFHGFYNRKNRRKFWKDCVRLFRSQKEGEHIFFLEFFGRRDFKLCALAALFFLKKTDSFWVLYRDDLTTRRKKDLFTIRIFSKLLNWRFQKRFLALTDSELLADYYVEWFKKRPIVLPIAHTQWHPLEEIKKDRRLVCIWPGNPRPEKGAKEIAHLVQILDPQSVNIELNVSGATLIPSIKNQIHLHLRKVLLTEEEYFISLLQSDVVLLPYDPEKYKWRTSGPFVEAVLAGKFPLVKEGSWLAYELKRYDLYELIVDWNNPQFFTDLLALVKNPVLRKKFKEMQLDYKKQHSNESLCKALSACLKSV